MQGVVRRLKGRSREMPRKTLEKRILEKGGLGGRGKGKEREGGIGIGLRDLLMEISLGGKDRLVFMCFVVI